MNDELEMFRVKAFLRIIPELDAKDYFEYLSRDAILGIFYGGF